MACFYVGHSKCIERTCKEGEWQGNHDTKIALQMFVTEFCWSPGPAKKLDEKYIYLVDNLKAFNAYPWGRISYEFIVSDIRSCMSDRVQNFWKRKEKKKVEKKKDHNMEKFDVSGFTHTLQVWAYEVMPELGKLCVKRVSGFTDATPRILRWIAEDAPRVKVAKILKPSHAEKSFGYFQSVAKWQQEQVAAVAANEDLDENVDVDASTTRMMRTREERTKNRHDVDAGKPSVHEVESDDEEESVGELKESVGGEEESESDDSDYKKEEASDDNEQE
ncbi:hypothetical protein DH2020_012688 [Rehmannia glutinosa]|uniref:DUF1985 domain-containing protein n=1 Tax=Rehmannia glutinosa TaxID=99300 RepID=A0ABR0X3I2_REHGL